jgi:alkylated DNA repair dioxygenase AlkB
VQSTDNTAPIALAPHATFERLQLDEDAWVDVCRGWLHGADALYAQAVAELPWRESKIFRYDRWVPEPRLGTWWKVGDPPLDPVVVEAHRSLQHRYKARFDGFGYAWYRDGNDGVAFHRDRDMRWLDDTVIGILTLGAQRPWLLRPRANRYDHAAEANGATHDFAPASGDLVVLGGACQARWEHSVPKVDPRIGGRISLQWRWTSRQGRMEKGGSYRAPRHFSS